MAPKKCVFCTIADKKDPKTQLLYDAPEDDPIPLIVFKDIKPVAKHHYLVCPKEHIKDCKGLRHKHVEMVEKMVAIGKQVLREQGGNEESISLGFHWPPFGLISHLHLHVISPPSDRGFLARQMFRPNSWWFVTPEWIIDRLKQMPQEES